MEKYVIDLDKVLDELELRDNDEAAEPFVESQFSSNVQLTNNSLQNYYAFQGTSILNSYDKIDVRDADFSIQSKPPKILNSIAILDSVNFNNNNQSNQQSVSISSINNSSFASFVAETNVNANQHLIENESDLNTEQPQQIPERCEDLVDAEREIIINNSSHEDDHSHIQIIDETTPPIQNDLSTDSENSQLHYNEGSKDIVNESNISVIENDNLVTEGDDCISGNEDSVLKTTTNDAPDEQLLEQNSENMSPSKCVPIGELNNSICDNVISSEDDGAPNLENVRFTEVDNLIVDDDQRVIFSDSLCNNVESNSTQAVCLESIVGGDFNETNASKDGPVEIETSDTIVDNQLENESLPIDINNMSEEELDRFLSDLETNEIENNPSNLNSTEGEEKCSTILPETSQSVSEEMCGQMEDINLQSVDTSGDNQYDQRCVDEPHDDDHNNESSPPELLNFECDSSVVSIQSIQVATIDNDLIVTEEHLNENFEPARPNTLTLPSASIEEQLGPEQIDPALGPQTSQQAACSSSGVAASVNEDANRGGLVQNIAYFERQDMPNGLTEEEQMLGKVKPFWIPDEDAQNCLHCDAKFTMIKRRHHCRSCGKVLCSQCCNYKAKLMYLENKEARVCQLCYVILMRIEEIEKANGHPIDISEMDQTANATNNAITISFPDPNNPAEYCSTISPFEQVAEAQNRPPPTVMVPVGVLKRPGSSTLRRRDNLSDSSQSGDRIPETVAVKQVIFSDGVRPGGDLVESPTTSKLPDERPIGRTQLQLKSPPAEKSFTSIEQTLKRTKPSRVTVADSNGVNLPPIINYNELKAIDPSLPSKPTYSQLVELLRSKHLPWITFGLTKNLFVNAKLISKLCCNSIECWSFASKGLATVGQDEVFFCLDCNSLIKPITSEDNTNKESGSNLENPNTTDFPRDVFRLFTSIYDSASKASLYTELSHIFFPDGLFGSKENSGFIFTRPTLQCFQNVQVIPSPPHLIALLIHKWEIPWAKVFPLRLVLRLGYEYKMYPSPVISFANRKPVYFEIGHTIMNVLADFRNFQYTLSVVKDLTIHVEEKKRVSLLIPKLSYEKVCKVLSSSNEHVLAFGGNFSMKGDSHFVCIQNEEDDDVQGQYHTEVTNFPGSPLKVTGASFIVFSGALKSTTGLKAKMNIVEDGLLVQIHPSTMEELRAAIRDMKEFKIDCCKVNETSGEEWVQINWVNDELSTNLGVRSQIDGLNLEGVQSARIFTSPDYTNERYLIRWIEVFLLQINENSRRSEMLNTSRLAEQVSQAFCVALIDYLDQLYDCGLTKIGLRVSLDVDKVGYEAGSGGEQLPPQFTGQLDSALIPAIMENISTTGIEDPLVIELLFYILLK